MESVLEQLTEEQRLVGLSVAYLEGSGLSYAKGFGRTTVEAFGTAVTPETLFLYCSVTKMLAAVLTMRLVDEGLLVLDRPVHDYIPNFRFFDPIYGPKITLRHILSHTTGLPMSGKSYGPLDRDALARFVLEEIPDYQSLAAPGTFVHYSNTVYCIAGYLAELVTGDYFDDLMQKWVFDPLEMTRSTFKPHVAMTYPVSLSHILNEEGKQEIVHTFPRNGSGNPSSFCYGNVLDMSNVASMFLNAGEFNGRRILSAETITAMYAPQGSCFVGGSSHFFTNRYQGNGLGLQVGEHRGIPLVRHPGGGNGFQIFFDMMPEHDAAILIMMNAGGGDGVLPALEAIFDNFAGDKMSKPLYAPAWPTLAAKPETMAELVGHYLDVLNGNLRAIKHSDSQLTISYQGADRVLNRIGEDQYYFEYPSTVSDVIHNISVMFLRDDEGQVAHMVVEGYPSQPVTPADSATLEPENWTQFSGLYKDPNNRWDEDGFLVELQDGQMKVTEDGATHEYVALDNHNFYGGHGLVTFLPAEEGWHLLWGKATRHYPVSNGSA